MLLTATDLSKSHGMRTLFKGVSMSIAEGDRLALIGPNGAGKSTLLRMLAAREEITDGEILIDDKVVNDLESKDRDIAMVFQSYALYPHMTVAQNMGFSLKVAGQPRQRVAEAVAKAAEALRIAPLLDRLPAELSGGERQRVAIGRALLTSPRVLLMDEPLASLDAGRKLEVLPFIERMRDEFAIPILYVSHAVEEVARLASQVVRLEAGRVAAVGPPARVLSAASLSRSADRFDAVSILRARVKSYEPDYRVTVLGHPAGEIVVPGRIDAGGGPVRIAIPATNVTISIGRPGNISVRTSLAGRVVKLETDEGPFALVTIELAGGDRLQAFLTRLACDRLGLGEGDEVLALVKAVAIDERSVEGLRLVGEART